MILARRPCDLVDVDRRVDRAVSLLAVAAAALAASVVALVFGFVLAEAAPLLVERGATLATTTWAPRAGSYGLVHLALGSCVVVAGAVLLAAPLGVLCGALASTYAPPAAASTLRLVLGVLAGVPSVVYGWWGLVVLVPRLGAIRPPGLSVLAGILVLALMILPTIALLAAGALQAVPKPLVDAGRALGLSRGAILLHVAAPAARGGLVAAVVLGTARALGETMAILLVMGNTIRAPSSLFEPARALTAHVALEAAYALGDHRRGLFAAGLVLLVAVGVLVVAADRTLRGRAA